MSADTENFTHHFKDSWDQTVGAWVSIFKGVRGASKVAAKGTKETISGVYEDSKAEAIVNISKDIVKVTAHGSTAAVGYVVEKGKEVVGLADTHEALHGKPAEADSGALTLLPQTILVAVMVGVVVAQATYIVYLYNEAQKGDKRAPRWHPPGPVRQRSPMPSPPAMEFLAADDLPLGQEEEDRRLAASEARYRKDMDMESVGSDSFY